MNNGSLAKSIRLASGRLSRLKSERDDLSEKVAKLEESLKEAEKKAKAHKLAMQLLLDEDVIGDVLSKEAQLLVHDLEQVEMAMNLNILNKEASIGTDLSEGVSANSGDALMDYLNNWAKSK